ncbi:unnamed protein product [Schistosoma rodhaini]|uniref:Reverse transcriptase domain-containing protein n=1 Tax=Schistosoma rodhaini TaxID=6188 RepID=A0AA85G1E0_9TREM|nr:unnamed protein product [Schistosoma rodhaini]
MFINIIKALYTNISGRVMTYNYLSSLYHSSSVVRQHSPISLFLLSVLIDGILESSLMDIGNGSVNLLPGERFFDIEYADNIVLLCDKTQAMQTAFSHLAMCP